MNRTQRMLLALGLGLVAVWGSAAAATRPVDAETCAVSGPAQGYALTIGDFGTGGSAYPDLADAGHLGGRGYLFGYRRGEWESYLSQPGGGYVYGAVAVAGDQAGAEKDWADGVKSWARGAEYEWLPVAGVGDAVVAGRRFTPWEIVSEQPMQEAFVSFRYCNATAQVLIATMPEFDALEQGLRYAKVMQVRMQR